MHFKSYSGTDYRWSESKIQFVTYAFYAFIAVTLSVTSIVLKKMPTKAKAKKTKTAVENLGNLTVAVDNYLANFGNTTNVTSKYGANIGVWDVSKVKDFTSVFSAARNPEMGLYDPATANFSLFNISGWNVTNGTSFSFMFSGSNFNGNISGWKVMQATNFTGMFMNAKKYNGTGLAMWNTGNATDLSHMFQDADSFSGVGVVETWATSNVVNMQYTFARNDKMTADLSGWNVSNVQMFNGMFEDADNFTGAGIENWDVSNAMSLDWMFANSESFDANLSAWDVSNVESMKGIFFNTESYQGNGLSEWVPDESVSMDGMFCNASGVNPFTYPTWVTLDAYCGDGMQSDLTMMDEGASM